MKIRYIIMAFLFLLTAAPLHAGGNGGPLIMLYNLDFTPINDYIQTEFSLPAISGALPIWGGSGTGWLNDSFGMGVVTHCKQGKTYHAAWSMDVKIEGKNVIRHLDMTTHNHQAKMPPNTACMTVDVGLMAPPAKVQECQDLAN